jgi:uncharacterized membrane protein YhhN
VDAVLPISVAAALSAALTIWGHYRAHRAVVYVCKPLTTSLILVLAVIAATARADRLAWAIVAGLALSLAGDVFLMLPRDLFRAGLASFLLAHLCYLVAFTADAPFARPTPPFILWAVVAAALLRALWPGLKASLRAPVTVYVCVLLTMAAQASSRAAALHTGPALAAAIGAALFALSDALLALDRFRRPFAPARALVRITYFAGQWLIALSAFPVWPLP